MKVTRLRPSVYGAGFTLAMLGLSASAATITLVSVEQEIAIGKQSNAQVRQQTPVIGDAAVVRFVRDVTGRLARAATGPKYPYSVAVADTREINAFALPGGPVWIHRGVIERATNESQVASVLAHEIAHIASGHAARQLTTAAMTQWGLNLLGSLLGNVGGAGGAQIAAGFLASGVFLKFNRDEEREADRVGLALMSRAGWDGRGMVEMFEILKKEAGRDPTSVDAFFASHPSPQDRIKDVTAAVSAHRKGRRDSREFQVIKARLLKLPPPRLSSGQARAGHNH
jgi:beta-barrel assembly-enhancing protease